MDAELRGRVSKLEEDLQLGDIVKCKDEFYLVVRQGDFNYGNDTFVARDLAGDQGLCGIHTSLNNLSEYAREMLDDAEILRKEDYKIVIEPK